jgi:hypothetical protein
MPGWSGYNYMMGAPTMGTDPDGRMPCLFTPQVCAALAGAATGFVTELVTQAFDETPGLQGRALIQSAAIGATTSYYGAIRTVGTVGKFVAGWAGDVVAGWSSAQIRDDSFSLMEGVGLGLARGGLFGAGLLASRYIAAPASKLSTNLGSVQTRLINAGPDRILDSGRVAGGLIGELAIERGELNSVSEGATRFSRLVTERGPAAFQIFKSIADDQVRNDTPLPIAR